MKRFGITVVLLLGLLIISVTACGKNNTETTSQQITGGETNATVTADGNIEARFHEKLTFGSGGKVALVAVGEGDNVSKGDVLARLDTSVLELAEAQAQVALTQAQVALTQAQVSQDSVSTALSRAKIAASQAEVAQYQAELNQIQAEVNLEAAKFDLDRMKDVEDIKDKIKEAENKKQVAEINLEDALKISAADVYVTGWLQLIAGAQQEILYYQQELADLLSKDEYSSLQVTEVKIKSLQVDAAEKAVEQAEKAVEQSRLAVDLAKQEVKSAEHSLDLAQQNAELAQQNVELAQKSLDQARKNLEEATIIAPFDGIVASIGVKEGEYLSPATFTGITAVEIIDPAHMELTARVNELDVVKVKTGQKVMSSVDAMPEMMLEGRVTFISPVARDPGAILFEDENEEKEYVVKIDFDIPENSPIRAGMSATAEIIVE